MIDIETADGASGLIRKCLWQKSKLCKNIIKLWNLIWFAGGQAMTVDENIKPQRKLQNMCKAKTWCIDKSKNVIGIIDTKPFEKAWDVKNLM